jgi:hypothetical protein
MMYAGSKQPQDPFKFVFQTARELGDEEDGNRLPHGPGFHQLEFLIGVSICRCF